MLVDSIRNTVLCDELQLGQTLNHCVAQGEGAKFALLLSLLSGDVLDQPQFDLLPVEKAKQDADLRQQFELAEPSPIYMEAVDSAQLERWNQATQQGDLVTSRLEMSLNPQGLVDKQPVLAANVLNNLPLLARLKYQARQQDKPKTDAQQTTKAELPEESAMYHVLKDFDYEKPLAVRYYD